VTISADSSAVQTAYFDPYDVELNADPYPMFRRLREEQPLYYNEQHDFYAISRFADVDNAIVDHKTFISRRGAILEIIKANMEIPSGTLIFEDPPIHDIHRKLLARMFTPRKINALEPKIRE
jgi:cytochrome P450